MVQCQTFHLARFGSELVRVEIEALGLSDIPVYGSARAPADIRSARASENAYRHRTWERDRVRVATISRFYIADALVASMRSGPDDALLVGSALAAVLGGLMGEPRKRAPSWSRVIHDVAKLSAYRDGLTGASKWSDLAYAAQQLARVPVPETPLVITPPKRLSRYSSWRVLDAYIGTKPPIGDAGEVYCYDDDGVFAVLGRSARGEGPSYNNDVGLAVACALLPQTAADWRATESAIQYGLNRVTEPREAPVGLSVDYFLPSAPMAIDVTVYRPERYAAWVDAIRSVWEVERALLQASDERAVKPWADLGRAKKLRPGEAH